LLVEHAYDNTNVRMELADHESGADADQVVVNNYYNAAGLVQAGLFQVGLLATISPDKSGAREPGVIGRATRVDHRDSQASRPEEFQDVPAHTSQAAQNDVVFHDAESTGYERRSRPARVPVSPQPTNAGQAEVIYG